MLHAKLDTRLNDAVRGVDHQSEVRQWVWELERRSQKRILQIPLPVRMLIGVSESSEDLSAHPLNPPEIFGLQRNGQAPPMIQGDARPLEPEGGVPMPGDAGDRSIFSHYYTFSAILWLFMSPKVTFFCSRWVSVCPPSSSKPTCTRASTPLPLHQHLVRSPARERGA
eukprot:EG_transcript_25206